MTEAAPPESAAPLESAAKTRKGEQTRAHILETALVLFRERGYEETTMRAIAEAAGVAVGNAYYYFRSKESLIQAFYELTHEEHKAASREVLEREKDFRSRLLGVMQAKIETAMPYHRFAAILFKTAADPESPLNPFSDASRELRGQSTRLFSEVIEGSATRLRHEELRTELPNLLWVYHMGIMLFWIHDSSPGCRRTYRLVEHTVTLVVRLVSLANLPLMRPLIRTTLELLADLRSETAPSPSDAQNSPTNAISGSKR